MASRTLVCAFASVEIEAAVVQGGRFAPTMRLAHSETEVGLLYTAVLWPLDGNSAASTDGDGGQLTELRLLVSFDRCHQ